MRRLVFIFAAYLLCACSADKKADYSDVHDISDLKGHSVAVSMGSSYDLMLSEMGGVNLVRLGVSELLLAVESGRAEFCIMDQIQAGMLNLADRGLEIRIRDILKGTAAAGFNKADTQLQAEFNAYLRNLKESGEYDRWSERWMSRPDSMADEALLLTRKTAGSGSRILKVGITINYPYIFYKEGGLTGMELDLMNRFCLYSGYGTDFQVTDFSALIPALNSRKIDVIVSHMRVTEERAQKVLFSDPYLQGGGAAVCRTSKTVSAKLLKGPWDRLKSSWRRNLVEEKRWKLLASGLLVTLEISLYSILAAIVAGVIMCRLRMGRSKSIRKTASAFIGLVRGIPLLVILMIMFYVVFASASVTALTVTVVSFGIYYGAYFGEVFRMGMESVDRGQWEAGLALGLGNFRTFSKIILPQALTRIIPVFKGEVITLIKTTSVVGYVAVMDLTKASDILRSTTLDALFPLLLVTLVYIVLSQLTGWGLDALDRRFTPKNRKS